MRESELKLCKPDRVRPLTPGDIVRLRSGGPAMTVSCADSDYGLVQCSWFWRSSRYSGAFQRDEVTRIEDEQYRDNVRHSLESGLESLDKWHSIPVTRQKKEKQVPVGMHPDEEATTCSDEDFEGEIFGV
jgi:uncharacterized protein YodC (DUF2158 family)